MTMLDDMREVFGAALKFLGLLGQLDGLRGAPKSQGRHYRLETYVIQIRRRGLCEADSPREFGPCRGTRKTFSGNTIRPGFSTLIFSSPREGVPMYMDHMVILKNTKARAVAYSFINYIHEPKVYAAIIDYLRYPSLTPRPGPFKRRNRITSFRALKNSEFKEDLGANLEAYNKLWQEIRDKLLPMKNYNFFLFDADGPIIDTMELIYRCFAHTCKKFIDKTVSKAEVQKNVGLTSRDQMEIYYKPNLRRILRNRSPRAHGVSTRPLS